MDFNERIRSLERQIVNFESKLTQLRGELKQTVAAKEASEADERAPSEELSKAIDGGLPEAWQDEIANVLSTPSPLNGLGKSLGGGVKPWKYPLQKEEYKRYGRQLIMPEIGLQGQLRLKKSRVLIVGVGGLGCPAAAYLAGAGVGTLGLVDGDVVEESNFHRQILHTTERVGMTKVDSAIESLCSLNPLVQYVPHRIRLSGEEALDIFADYDLVLDCTDTPASRYLISDVCVTLGKPLVSASALKTEGQLMGLNNPPRPPGMAGGPCYRCIFPKPPPAESVVSCGEGGILGPVVGVMGVLQALEAIKIITTQISDFSKASGDRNRLDEPKHSSLSSPSMLLFSAYSNPRFRQIRLRSRKKDCAACSSQSCINKGTIRSGMIDYVQFCGTIAPVNELPPSERVSATQLAKTLNLEIKGTESPILIDTRDKTQFDICHIDGSYNIPFSNFTLPEPYPKLPKNLQLELTNDPERAICMVCRLGNDSQIAAKRLQKLGLGSNGKRWIGDLKGGLKSWREDVDGDFPDY